MTDSLYRFEFDESYVLNALVVRASSFIEAYENAAKLVGFSRFRHFLRSIHKID